MCQNLDLLAQTGRLLADATPNSITIVTVGPLANIQNLLRSEPDKISPLTGAELVVDGGRSLS